MTENDYQTISSIMHSSIRSGSTYHYSLSDCQILIFQILENNFLEEPNKNQTKDFINNLIPFITKSILNLIIRDQEEFEHDFEFLSTVTSLCVWGFQNKIESLKELIISIMDKNNFYYSSRANDNSSWKNIAENFFFSGAFEETMKTLVDSKEIFDINIQILLSNYLKEFLQSDEILTYVKQITCNISNWILTLNSHFQNQLDLSLKIYFDLLNSLNEGQSELFVSLFNVIADLIKSGIIDKQLLFIAILKIYFISNHNSMNNLFSQWMSENAIIQSLLDASLPNQVLEESMDLFRLFSESKLITIDDFQTLYKLCLEAHFSQKPLYSKFVGFALNCFSDSSLFSFINQLISNSNENILIEQMQFLIQFLITYNDSYPEILKIIVPYFFKRAAQDLAIKECLFDNFSKISSDLVIDLILKECYESIQHNESLDFSQQLISKCISKQNDHYIEMNIEPHLVELSQEHRNIIFPLITSLRIKRQSYLTQQDVLSFSNIKDDLLWDFFSNIFHQIGKKGVNDSSLNEIISIASTFDYSKATYSFQSFLSDLIIFNAFYYDELISLKSNYKNNFIPNSYTFSKFPISHIDLLFKLIEEAEDPLVIQKTINLLIEIHYNFKNFSPKIVTDFIFEQILPIFGHYTNEYYGNHFSLDQISHPKDTQKTYTNEVQKRYMIFLLKLIKKIEKTYNLENTGLFRHKDLCDPTIYKITLNLHKGQKIDILANSCITFSKLAHQIESIIITDEIFFIKYHGDYMNSSEKLIEIMSTYSDYSLDLSLSYKSNGTILIKHFSDMPSLLLFKDGLAQTLIKMIHDSNNKEFIQVIMEFLQFLPSDLIIMDLIKDPSAFKDILENSKSEEEKLYYLECFAESPNTEGLPFIFSIILSSEPSDSIKYTCIRIIYHYFKYHKNEKISKEIEEYLLNIIGKGENVNFNLLKIVIEILKITGISYFTEALSNAILNSPKCIWYNLMKIVLKTNFQKELLTFIIPQLDRNKELPSNSFSNIIDLFKYLVQKADDTFDLKLLFNKSYKITLASVTNQSQFESFCQIIHSMLNAHPEFISEAPNLIEELLPLAFQTNNMKKQIQIFDTVSLLDSKDNSFKERCYYVLNKYLKNPISNYSYDVSADVRAEGEFAGLTNLGTTCYMNSIFQQLFFSPQFKQRVLELDFSQLEKEAKENQNTSSTQENQNKSYDGLKEFQELLLNMEFSYSSYAKTYDFCKSWRGWENQLINVHQQQDAMEFFQFFLDSFPPSVQSLYSGQFLNTIDGENYHSENTEDFFMISLEVQSFSSIIDSLKSMKQQEKLSNFKNEQNQDIEAIKTLTIKKLPPILVLHLKRFTYQMKTWERIKLNSMISFPQILNLAEFLDQPTSEPLNYNLAGVVQHSGTAYGGHYTSLIFKNNEWLKFNDRKVSKLDPSEFESQTFGGSSNNPSAYLLFYVLSGFEQTDGGHEFLLNYVQSRNDFQDIIKEIQKQNNEIIETQALFSSPFQSFIMNHTDDQFLCNYFFSVFCHSSSCENNFVSNSIISSFKSSPAAFFDYIHDHLNEFSDILSYVTDENVCKALILIIENLLLFSCDDFYNSKDIIQKFGSDIFEIFSKNSKLGQKNLIGQIMLITERRSPKGFFLSWLHPITQIILTFYQEQKSQSYLENVNFSSLFLILFDLSPFDLNYDYTPFSQISRQILLSKSNASSFISFASLFHLIICTHPIISEVRSQFSQGDFNNVINDWPSSLPFKKLLNDFGSYSHNFNISQFLSLACSIISGFKDTRSYVIEIILQNSNIESHNVLNHYMYELCNQNILLKKAIIEDPELLIVPFISEEKDIFLESFPYVISALFPTVRIPKYYPHNHTNYKPTEAVLSQEFEQKLLKKRTSKDGGKEMEQFFENFMKCDFLVANSVLFASIDFLIKRTKYFEKTDEQHKLNSLMYLAKISTLFSNFSQTDKFYTEKISEFFFRIIFYYLRSIDNSIDDLAVYLKSKHNIILMDILSSMIHECSKYFLSEFKICQYAHKLGPEFFGLIIDELPDMNYDTLENLFKKQNNMKNYISILSRSSEFSTKTKSILQHYLSNPFDNDYIILNSIFEFDPQNFSVLLFDNCISNLTFSLKAKLPFLSKIFISSIKDKRIDWSQFINRDFSYSFSIDYNRSTEEKQCFFDMVSAVAQEFPPIDVKFIDEIIKLLTKKYFYFESTIPLLKTIYICLFTYHNYANKTPQDLDLLNKALSDFVKLWPKMEFYSYSWNSNMDMAYVMLNYAFIGEWINEWFIILFSSGLIYDLMNDTGKTIVMVMKILGPDKVSELIIQLFSHIKETNQSIKSFMMDNLMKISDYINKEKIKEEFPFLDQEISQ